MYRFHLPWYDEIHALRGTRPLAGQRHILRVEVHMTHGSLAVHVLCLSLYACYLGSVNNIGLDRCYSCKVVVCDRASSVTALSRMLQQYVWLFAELQT